MYRTRKSRKGFPGGNGRSQSSGRDIWPSIPVLPNPPTRGLSLSTGLVIRRLSENHHLPRYPHPASLQRTDMYASLHGILDALYLGIFHQPLMVFIVLHRSNTGRNLIPRDTGCWFLDTGFRAWGDFFSRPFAPPMKSQ